jgi:hypothetical protein
MIINGITWTPQDAATHATDMLNSINSARSARGESPIVATSANVIWIILLACGSVAQAEDADLLAAIQSLDISLADQAQILSLLPIAGTSLIPGSYSTLTIRVTAGPGGSAVIPLGAQAPYGTVNFVTLAATTIPAGTYADIETRCDTIGPVVVTVGQITRFLTSYSNVASVTNLVSAVAGSDNETPDGARARLLTGRVIDWNVDGVARAIRSIPGIQNAQVYFNYSNTTNLVLNSGQSILPRNARIFIQGSDSTGTAIATTYASRMTAPTVGASSQNYTTLAGQIVPVSWDPATTQNFWIKLYYDNSQPIQGGALSQAKTLLLAQQQYLSIGETVTSDFVLNALINFQYATITGAEVSLDNITYGRKSVTLANSVPTIMETNITLTGE